MAALGEWTVVEEQKCFKGTVAIGEKEMHTELDYYQREKNAQRAQQLLKLKMLKECHGNYQRAWILKLRTKQLPELVVTWQGNLSGGGHHPKKACWEVANNEQCQWQ